MFHFGILSSGIPYIIIGAVYLVYMMSFAIGKFCNAEDSFQDKTPASSVSADGFNISMDYPQNYIVSSDEFIAEEKNVYRVLFSFIAPVKNYKAIHFKVPIHCTIPSLFPNPPPVV